MHAPSTPPPGPPPAPTSASSKMTASSTPRQVLCSFPSGTGHGAGAPPSPTIADASAVTSANTPRAVQPMSSHSLLQCLPQSDTRIKSKVSLSHTPNPFQLLGIGVVAPWGCTAWVEHWPLQTQGSPWERKLSQERTRIPTPEMHLQRMSHTPNLCQASTDKGVTWTSCQTQNLLSATALLNSLHTAQLQLLINKLFALKKSTRCSRTGNGSTKIHHASSFTSLPQTFCAVSQHANGASQVFLTSGLQHWLKTLIILTLINTTLINNTAQLNQRKLSTIIRVHCDYLWSQGPLNSNSALKNKYPPSHPSNKFQRASHYVDHF